MEGRLALGAACLVTVIAGCNAMFGVSDLRYDGGPLGSGGSGAGPQQGGGGAGGEGAGGAPTGGGGTGGTPAGMGGATPVDCSGLFGSPTQLWAGSDNIASPSIAGDELTLYVVIGSAEVATLTRTDRGDGFDDLTPLQGLSNGCDDLNDPILGIDVSADETEAFLACGNLGADTPATVRRFVNEGGGWALDDDLGGFGSSPGLSADGQQLYATFDDPMFAERDASGVFGNPSPVPGLINSALLTATPAPDLLTLFGYRTPQNADYELVFATRPDLDSPFDAELKTIDTGMAAASPDITDDCRRIYFIGITQPGGGLADIFSVELIER